MVSQSRKSSQTISNVGEEVAGVGRVLVLKSGRRLVIPALPAACESCGHTGSLGYRHPDFVEQFCSCPLGLFYAERERVADERQREQRRADIAEATLRRLAAFSTRHLIDGKAPTFDALRPIPALEKVRAFGAAWDGRRNLLLHGPVGVGKTQLLIALVRELMPDLLQRYQTVRLVTVPDFLNELRAGFDREKQQATESYTEKLETYKTCGLLVFDDLGAEKLTDWVLEQFYLLFDARYRANLPIFATSNYSLALLKERLDERVFDRIRETFAVLEITGANQRDEAIKTRKVVQG